MATEKQIAANRLNARKATGPRTAKGKAISSGNALKTGRFAKSELALAMAEYQTLIADYTSEFHPRTPEARFYVRMLVQCLWQTRQLWRIETALWNDHLSEVGVGTEHATGIVFSRAYKELDRVGRATESADNGFHMALKQLLAIRTREQKAASPRRRPASAASPANSGLQLVA